MKVLAKHDVNGVPECLSAMPFFHIFLDLSQQFLLVGPAHDIDFVDHTQSEHDTSEILIRSRFTGLERGAQQNVSYAFFAKVGQNLVNGGALGGVGFFFRYTSHDDKVQNWSYTKRFSKMGEMRSSLCPPLSILSEPIARIGFFLIQEPTA
jgi:hypothetical protein